MPRYFLHRIGRMHDMDVDGVELFSLDHVRHEAIAFAADTLKDSTFALSDSGEVRIEVFDSAKILIFAIRISVFDRMPDPST